MKTKYFSVLLMLFLGTFFSCKEELKPQESSSGTLSPVSSSVSNSSTSPSGLLTNSTQNPSLPQQNSNLTAAGMNPPHGQAGHRCDIAVGAPLNSAPKTSTVNKSVSNPAMPTIVKSNAAAVVTQPGMNPPHGQAGHRCDVAVGAPLNKDVPVPAASNSNSNSQVPTILKLDSTATSPK